MRLYYSYSFNGVTLLFIVLEQVHIMMIMKYDEIMT